MMSSSRSAPASGRSPDRSRRPRAPSRVIDDFGQRTGILGGIVRGSRRDERHPLRILEAGCGTLWSIDLAGTPVHITGVDSDAEALRLRRSRYGDLDEEIVGDLRSVALPAAAFDCVYCSFVLEHVEGAESVLEKLLEAVRPGGTVIVRVPDRDTVYGFLVRHSPHRLHVLVKRYVEGDPLAGEPGHAPYPTVYDPIVSLRALHEFADSHGAEVVHDHASRAAVARLGRLAPVADAVSNLVARMSGGRLLATHEDICVVLRRGASSPQR